MHSNPLYISLQDQVLFDSIIASTGDLIKCSVKRVHRTPEVKTKLEATKPKSFFVLKTETTKKYLRTMERV